MMKEEKMLKGMFGRENHFAVPEGYFDSFADKLMEQLPATDARIVEMHAESWWHRLPLRKVAAVVGVAALLGGGGLFYVNHGLHTSAQMAGTYVESPVTGNSEYSTFDQMADYTMMDNQDIYVSLVAEN